VLAPSRLPVRLSATCCSPSGVSSMGMRSFSAYLVAAIGELKSYTARGLEAEVGKPEEPYIRIIVETYYESGSGLHGDIHVRPIAGQQVSQSLRVRFPRALRHAHPVGTRFRVFAKLTDREGGSDFVHTNHAWDVEVLGPLDE
jgi:hypothetical protein